jgi:hypothetical protein
VLVKYSTGPVSFKLDPLSEIDEPAVTGPVISIFAPLIDTAPNAQIVLSGGVSKLAFTTASWSGETSGGESSKVSCELGVFTWGGAQSDGFSPRHGDPSSCRIIVHSAVVGAASRTGAVESSGAIFSETLAPQPQSKNATTTSKYFFTALEPLRCKSARRYRLFHVRCHQRRKRCRLASGVVRIHKHVLYRQHFGFLEFRRGLRQHRNAKSFPLVSFRNRGERVCGE